jgi:hypothetical protein
MELPVTFGVPEGRVTVVDGIPNNEFKDCSLMIFINRICTKKFIKR